MALVDYCLKNGIEIKLPLPRDEKKLEIKYPDHTRQPEPIKEHWDIEGIEKFLSITIESKETIQLNPFTSIIDVKKFLSSHLSIAKAKNGEGVYRPYWERLLEYKRTIELI